MTWPVKSIRDLGHIVTGKTPSTSNPAFFNGDYLFVTPSDLSYAGYYCLQTERTITESAKQKHLSQFIPANSVMFTCIGNTIGKCAISSSDCLTNQQINSIVPNEENDPAFIYYLLCHYVDAIRTHGGGSATPIINKTNFSSLRFPVPPLSLQKKISALLESYDKLIENNRRRIQLLEVSTCLFYEEWFTHLRYPGHEISPEVDGVPRNWEKRSLSELADSVSYGFTASSTPAPVGPKLLRITDIVPPSINFTSVPHCTASEKETIKYRLVPGDIVVARTGATVGYAKQITHCESDTIFASYLVRFRFSEKIVSEIPGIFMQSEEYKNYVRANAGGAAQPNANAVILGSAKILVPPKIIQDAFREKVSPIIKQKAVLERSIEKLCAARDLLLPLLMNREIAV